MESGIFTIFQYNGKDLFLQAPDEHFVVLSHQELTHDFRMLIAEGREVEITTSGEIIMVPTAAEIEIVRRRMLKTTIRLRIEDLKKQRHLAVTRAEQAQRKRLEEEYQCGKKVRKEQILRSIEKAEAADESGLDPWSGVKLDLLKKELATL